MTIEALPVSRGLAQDSRARDPIGKPANPAGIAAAPAPDERPVRPPAPARRKPVKLDRDSVLDPFE